MKEPRLYFLHVVECIDRIERYVADGREAFLASELIQDAVIRNLQTMAESVKRIPDDRKRAFPAIDWPAVVAFRNILVHDYLGVNVERVWEVIVRDLPPLKRGVETMLASDG
jgi:uncharacterized protein with HEPN domain